MPQHNQGRPQRAPHHDVAKNRRVLQVSKEVSATLGATFFRSLAEHLAKALLVDCAYVGELVRGPANKLRTLAVYRNGEPAEEFEQDLPGTASAQVMADGAVAWSEGVSALFPLDPLLQDNQAFVGTRLGDSAGQVLGLIAVVHGQKLRNVPLAKSVLEAFAPRAAGELQRKQADEAQRQSEERYRAFIASNLDSMWRIELEKPVPLDLSEEEQIDAIYRFGYVAECNEAACRSLGVRSPADLMGARFGAIFLREDERILKEMRDSVRSGYSFSTVLTSPIDQHGRRLYRLRSHCGIVENGQLVRMWGTTRDITELKEAESALQASERRFREVLESVQLPAVILDSGGGIAFVNDSLLGVAHWSREELASRNWFELAGSPAERDKWVALLSQGNSLAAPERHFEGVMTVKDAIPRLIAWDTALLRNEAGEPVGLAAIGRDITDHRALEAQLLQAQKLESIGRLAGGVAHDFNNLLTVVIGHTALLIEQADDSHPMHAALVEIERAAGQCADLTDQLLAIGRKQRSQPELVDLNGLIAGEERLLRTMTGDGVELVTEPGAKLGPVYADPRQIRRILTNLVTNARDAMPLGGKLIIATTNFELRTAGGLYPAEVQSGAYVRLSVTDTGTGLTEEVRARMFDPFFTTKSLGKGTGLGLSTVYGIVRQSGGYIFAHGEPGEGACFEILLPIAAGASASTRSAGHAD